MNRIVRSVALSVVAAVFWGGWCPSAWGGPVNWIGDGGDDTSIGTAANWGGTLPDLTGGSITPNFLNGKSADLDRDVYFEGVRLVTDGFALTASKSDAEARIGAVGVETKDLNRSYSWGWPAVLTTNQLWNVAGTGAVLTVTAPIRSESAVRWTLGGKGSTIVSGSLSLAGVVALTNGTMVLSSADLTAGDALEVDANAARLELNGATLRRNVRNVTDSVASVSLFVAAGTTNAINGDLDLSTTNQTELDMGAGSALTVTGRLRRRGVDKLLIFRGETTAQSTCRLDGAIDAEPGVTIAASTGIDLCLNAASNALGGATLRLSSDKSRLLTTQPYALATDGDGRRASVNFNSAKPTWDLSGCDQEIAAMVSRGKATVTSEAPAVLRIADEPAANATVTNAAVFAGAAGLSFAGGGRLCLTGESSTQGTLEVTAGELELPEGAGWPQASVARASGGVLTIRDRTAFGRQTRLEVANGGQIALTYTGFMRIGRLVVDGEEKPSGTYGATGSGAMHELSCLTGAGRLHVGQVGLMGIVR